MKVPTRPSRPAVIVLIAGALLVWVAGTASAHSVLISMNPADGSTVSTAPSQVLLTFNENIQNIGDGVVVTAPDGTRVDNGRPSILDATVTERLKPLTLSGHYIVSYRVVSADGHPVTRTLGFTYTGGTRPAARTATVTKPSQPAGTRWGLVLAALGALGALAALGVASSKLVLARRRRVRSSRTR
jgi:methionine-rich copper-binding protein CopC